LDSRRNRAIDKIIAKRAWELREEQAEPGRRRTIGSTLRTLQQVYLPAGEAVVPSLPAPECGDHRGKVRVSLPNACLSGNILPCSNRWLVTKNWALHYLWVNLLEGTFDLNSHHHERQGRACSLLLGGIDFKAGTEVYRYPALAKIFSVLSVTEIFRGRAPSWAGSTTFLAVKRPAWEQIGGESIHRRFFSASYQGSVDIAGKKEDLVVLISFST
jgi:hypothetical protein